MNKPSERIEEIYKDIMFFNREHYTEPTEWQRAIMEYLDERYEDMQRIINNSNK